MFYVYYGLILCCLINVFIILNSKLLSILIHCARCRIEHMNTKKLTDFSNIYSPKNKSFMSRLPNRLNISPKNSTSSHHKQSGHKSYSPVLKTREQQGSIFQVPKIEQQKKIKKLQLGKQKIKNINYTLELQAKSMNQFEKRLKAKDYYIKYEENPFTDRQSKKVKTDIKQKEQKDKRKRYKNIIEAINSQKQTNFIQQLRKKAEKIQYNANNYLFKMQKIRRRQKYHPKYYDIQEKMQKQLKNQTIQYRKSAIQQLDSIVSIRQQSYFKVKRAREPFNLFEILSNPNSIMFQSGRQQLKTCYFSVDSMSNFVQTQINEVFMRSLSTYARISAVKSSSKEIPKDFKLTDINRIFDEDKQSINSFIFIANGQVTPALVLNYLNEDVDIDTAKVQNIYQMKQVSDQKYIIGYNDHKVIYRPNTQDYKGNWNCQDYEKAENAYYQELPFVQVQTKQIQLSNNYLRQIKNTIFNQMDCFTKDIKDKKLQQVFGKKKFMLMSQQMDTDANNRKNKESIDAKIRRNKLHKNRAELLKSTIVKNTVRQMKQVQSTIKKQLQQRR